MNNEINQTLHESPQPCITCGFYLPPIKSYTTGILTYTALPDNLCDECRDDAAVAALEDINAKI